MNADWLSACSWMLLTATACGPLVNDPTDSGAAASGNGGGSSGSSQNSGAAGATSGASGNPSNASGAAPSGSARSGSAAGSDADSGGGAAGSGGASADSGPGGGPTGDEGAPPAQGCPSSSTPYAAGSGLPRSGWVATASSTGTDVGDSLGNVFDGDATTRWASGKPQTTGDWFKVNFGHSITVSQVVLYLGTTMGVVNLTDFAQMYEVGVSNDDAAYSLVTPTSGTVGAAPATPICFAPQSAQYVKITLTAPAADGKSWWSIYEVTAAN